MKEFIPEKAMVVKRDKEMHIVMRHGRAIYILIQKPREMEAIEYFERLRRRFRKDRRSVVEILQTAGAREKIGSLIKPIQEFCYRVVMGQKVRLKKEE